MLAFAAALLLSAPPADVDLPTVLANWHAAAAKIETLTLEGTAIAKRDWLLPLLPRTRRVAFRFRSPHFARMDVFEEREQDPAMESQIFRSSGKSLEFLQFRDCQWTTMTLPWVGPANGDLRRMSLAQCFFLPDPTRLTATLDRKAPHYVLVTLKPQTVRREGMLFGFLPTNYEERDREIDWLRARVRIDTSTWLPRRITIWEDSDSSVEFDFPTSPRINEPLDDACFNPPKRADEKAMPSRESTDLSLGRDNGRGVATISDAHQVDPGSRHRHEPLPIPVPR